VSLEDRYGVSSSALLSVALFSVVMSSVAMLSVICGYALCRLWLCSLLLCSSVFRCGCALRYLCARAASSGMLNSHLKQTNLLDVDISLGQRVDESS
jgi:hypothetical protein